MPLAVHQKYTPIAVCLENKRRKCYPNGPPCPNPERCLRRCRTRRLKTCPSATSITESRPNTKYAGGRKRIKNTNSSRSLGTVEMFLREQRKQARLKRIDATTGTQYYQRYMRKRAKLKHENNGQRKAPIHRTNNRSNCVIL